MATLTAPLESALMRDLDRKHVRVWRPSRTPAGGLEAARRDEVAHRLVRAGSLERLERGAYLVVPRSGARLVPPLELVGAWFEGEPFVVVGATAAEYHGLTLDTPSVIDVQLARAKREVVRFQDKVYRFTRSDRESVAADNVVIRAGEQKTSVATPAKLLVLLLNQPRRGPGTARDSRLAMEVFERGVRSNVWRSVRWARVVRLHGTAATARRLGYLLERFDQPGWDRLLPMRGRAGYSKFSAIHEAVGQVDTRWRLRLNDPVLSRLNATADA